MSLVRAAPEYGTKRARHLTQEAMALAAEALELPCIDQSPTGAANQNQMIRLSDRQQAMPDDVVQVLVDRHHDFLRLLERRVGSHAAAEELLVRQRMGAWR